MENQYVTKLSYEQLDHQCKQLSYNIKNIVRQSIQKYQNKPKMAKICQRDQNKILQLFSYDKWSQYMNWVEEKLIQSGENIQPSQNDIIHSENSHSEKSNQKQKSNQNHQENKLEQFQTPIKKTFAQNTEINKSKQLKKVKQEQQFDKLRQNGQLNFTKDKEMKSLMEQIEEERRKKDIRNNKHTESEVELMAVQNAKLRKRNIILKNQLYQLNSYLQFYAL